jgi:hypothetical protein
MLKKIRIVCGEIKILIGKDTFNTIKIWNLIKGIF